MEIQAEQHEQALVISVAGSIDAFTADEATAFLNAQIAGGQTRIVLDLSQVDFMSSSGIRLVLEGLKRCRAGGGDLHLAGARPGVHRTLEVSGLARVVQMLPSVQEALACFGP